MILVLLERHPFSFALHHADSLAFVVFLLHMFFLLVLVERF